MNDSRSAEFIARLKDPKFYIESFCKIKAKRGGLVPFILKEAQKDIFNTLADHNKVIILKARQLGFSVALSAWLYHYAITHPGVTVALIGYNREMTGELLENVKILHSTTPEKFRPLVENDSKHEFTFPKTKSKLVCLPSSKNVGRGYRINACLITELAFWDDADEKMTSLLNCIPPEENSRIIIESTPNGMGNLYHRTWVDDSNGYEKKKYMWWWEYNKQQIEEVRQRKNDPMAFAQEYECAFLASGMSVFDQEAIERQRKNILRVGEIRKGTDFKVYEKDTLRVYREPEAGKLYVCGVDVSAGVEGGDYSVAVIFDRKTGEEVAFYRGLIHPDRLSHKLNEWGHWYNKAYMVIEINNHGLTTVTGLRNLIYPSLYFRPGKIDTISSQMTEKIGWQTNVKTKPILIDEFNKAIRDDELIIHSKEILDEMTVLVYDENNNIKTQSGFHDDTVFASAIAFQGFKMLYDKPLTQIDLVKNFVY